MTASRSSCAFTLLCLDSRGNGKGWLREEALEKCPQLGKVGTIPLSLEGEGKIFKWL